MKINRHIVVLNEHNFFVLLCAHNMTPNVHYTPNVCITRLAIPILLTLTPTLNLALFGNPIPTLCSQLATSLFKKSSLDFASTIKNA
jgi:hypothetical protein